MSIRSQEEFEKLRAIGKIVREVLDKVAEVRRLVLSLKERHGYRDPTDDSDEWSEGDEHELTAHSLDTWDAREATEGE